MMKTFSRLHVTLISRPKPFRPTCFRYYLAVRQEAGLLGDEDARTPPRFVDIVAFSRYGRLGRIEPGKTNEVTRW